MRWLHPGYYLTDSNCRPAFPFAQRVAGYDLILRNGDVIDGSGAPMQVADVAVKDGKMAAIEDHIVGNADNELDATGIATPGFVDVHTHPARVLCA